MIECRRFNVTQIPCKGAGRRITGHQESKQSKARNNVSQESSDVIDGRDKKIGKGG